MLGREAFAAHAALEEAFDATLDGRALRELAQRELEAYAPRLLRAQRHDGAARLCEAVFRERADAREDGRQRRGTSAVADGFLGGAELHQDAGETLRQSVMDFLADAVALGEHGGLLGGDAELLHADGESRLVREREDHLHALRGQRFALPEDQRE